MKDALRADPAYRLPPPPWMTGARNEFRNLVEMIHENPCL